MIKIDYSLFDYSVTDYALKYQKPSCPLIPSARPFGLLQQQKPKTAILAIHGYTGYAGELVRPCWDLFKVGYDVFAIRLPGYGTCAMDLLETTYKMWVDTAMDAYEDLCEKYEKVYVVAHSMGCAIALLLAQKTQIQKMVLFSPALDYCVPFKDSFGRDSWSLPWKQDPSFTLYYEGAPNDDLLYANEYWKTFYSKALRNFYFLMGATKKGLKLVNSSLLVLYGDQDFCVSNQSRLIGRSNQGSTLAIEIPNGTHLLPYDKDLEAQEQSIQECVSFLSL